MLTPADIPEVVALRGIQQPAAHHPEIDTYVHVEMAWQQALRLTDDPAIHLAVLLHDLGKALTPADKLPSHPGHEEAGVPLVQAVCRRLGVDMRNTQLCIDVCAYHLRCHRSFDLSPSANKRFLREMGTHDLERFLIACECDARGRLGLEDRPYPQSQLLRDLAAEMAADDQRETIKRVVSDAMKPIIVTDEMTPARWRALREATRTFVTSAWEALHGPGTDS